MKKVSGQLTSADDQRLQLADQYLELFNQIMHSANVGPNWHRQLLVGLRPESLARILSLFEIYQTILETPGVVLELGVHWGAGLTILGSLQSVLEPFNDSRRFIGFDTFEGFPAVGEFDGPATTVGDYSSDVEHFNRLSQILSLHGRLSQRAIENRFQLVPGDVTHSLPCWLNDNPSELIALVVFDLDLYHPTKACLDALKPRLQRGSILVFDELGHPGFPGETRAFIEELGLTSYKIKRSKYQAYTCWIEV